MGKTTSAVNIGAGLASFGKSVMLVDMDPQSHLTCSMGIRPQEKGGTVHELLRGDATLADVTVQVNGIAVVPSSIALVGADMELSRTSGREFLLRNALRGKVSADYLIIDCPPTLGLLSLNALTTVDEVYIPVQPEFLALQGLSRLLKAIRMVRERLNPRLRITGVILTRYDRRKGLNKEVMAMLHKHFGPQVFNTVIRDNIALAEAPGYGMSIFEYREKSHGAEDYRNLCLEILKRSGD